MRHACGMSEDPEAVAILLTSLAVIGRLLLAAVFALSGLAKLADRNGTRKTVVGFGVPKRLAGACASGLPIAELAVAGLLLPASTPIYGAIGALALLVMFSCAIAWNLARGRSPDCHCFGQLHSAPAGRRTLVRNGALALLALPVLLAGGHDAGPGAFAWTARLDGVEWLVPVLGACLVAVIVGGGLVVAHVLRSYGRVLVRLDAAERRLREAGFELYEDVPEHGLSAGTPAPAFWLPSTDGSRVALDDLIDSERPLLLLFTSATCGPCSLLMPEVARWQREHVDRLTVALLADGDPQLIRGEAAEHGLRNVLVDETLSTYEAYGANGTPSAVLVGTDGTIATSVAAGADWIASLVEQVLADPGGTAALALGADLPSIRLPSLAGDETSLTELVAEPSVILFWNPGCGFCRSMHDDVKVWEQDRPGGAPSLVIVSAGTADDVRAEGFASPVLLDPEWSASTALGVDGTPMALLVEVDGRIASGLVTGAGAVLELLGAGAVSTAT